MQSLTRLGGRLPSRVLPTRVSAIPIPTTAFALSRPFHAVSSRAADVAPIVGTGPPPQAPVSQAEEAYARVRKRKRQAEMLRLAKEAKAGKGKGLSKRFWDEVTVREVDGMSCPSAPLFFFPPALFASLFVLLRRYWASGLATYTNIFQ